MTVRWGFQNKNDYGEKFIVNWRFYWLRIRKTMLTAVERLSHCGAIKSAPKLTELFDLS